MIESDDTISSIGDDEFSDDEFEDIFAKYAFGKSVRKCGNLVNVDVYINEAECDNKVWVESVKQAVMDKMDTFKNLVITLRTSKYMHKKISINKVKILSKNRDFMKGLGICLQQLSNANFLELYDNYEESYKSYLDQYNVSMDEFIIDTTIFHVAYDRQDHDGGNVIVHGLDYLLYEYVNYLGGPHDCLFNCIIHDYFKDKDINKVRKDVMYIRNKIKCEYNIPFSRLYKIEAKLKIKIIIYHDSLVNGKLNVAYNNPKIIGYSKICKLIWSKNHYYNYRGINKNYIDNLFNVNNNASAYIFYDFETYMDPKNNFEATPYCLSIIVQQDNQVTSKVIYKDKLDDDFNNAIYETFKEYFDNKRFIIIGFNNGAFDDYMLLKILLNYNRGMGKTFIDRSSRILNFNYKNFSSKDVFRFVMTSLSNATISFGCDKIKTNLNHDELQDYINKGEYDIWIQNNKDNLIEYANRDVVSLRELYFKLQGTFKSIDVNLDMVNSMTLSQMSMKAFRTNFCKPAKKVTGETFRHNLPILDYERDIIVRNALVGGRCQIFKTIVEEKYYVQSIDVISLYPYVMMNKNYPYLEEVYNSHGKLYNKMPLESWFIYTRNFVLDYLGIYHVKIISQPKDKIIPHCNVDGSRDWDYNHIFTTWSDSVSLNLLLEYGGKFEVIEGYYFKLPSKPIFKDYLQNIMNRKIDQDRLKDESNISYNPALRECLKLLMNSLSGKMGQLPIDCEKQICDTDKTCDSMILKYGENSEVIPIDVDKNIWLIKGTIDENNIRINSPTILAIFIYSYAREYMYKNFISKVEHKYGMDTDSLFLRVDELNKIDHKLFGSNAGQIKVELPNDSYGIYVAKKIYANYSKKGEIYKFKFKGIGKYDKFVSYDKVDDIRSLIDSRLNDKLKLEYDSFNIIYNNIDILKSILGHEIIYILCKQIRRYMNEGMIIQENYVLKEIRLDEFIIPY